VAEQWMDWRRIGPLAEQDHALIAEEIRADTRELYSTEGSLNSILMDQAERGGGPVGGAMPTRGLKHFFQQRLAFLLNHPDLRR
jgi:hypothetical protein